MSRASDDRPIHGVGVSCKSRIASQSVAEAPPYPRLAVDEASQALLVSRYGLDASRLVALCPGAEFGPAKQWPLEQVCQPDDTSN